MLKTVLLLTKAMNITITTFANSDGWNEKNPMSNQLVAPFTGFVNITAISRIINIP